MPLSTSEASLHSSRRMRLLAILAIPALALLAYLPSFSGVFIYDDQPAILLNETFGSFWSAFCPPADTTVSGRPVANLTFAVNHALGGTHTWGYHAVNLLIHILAGLTLFAVVRRTLELPTPEGTRARSKFWPTGQPAIFAFAVALLWTLHPLQTESVTYIVQRVESLMTLFYLLTFYFFLRALQSPHPRRWLCLATTTCLLGMGTKEVMSTAPVLLFLFDRTFVTGSFRRTWTERRGFYLALAATWIPLAALVASTGWNRGGSVGFDVGTSVWTYWGTQLEAVPHYLRLALWPHPLVFDYPAQWVRHPAELAGYAAIVATLIVGTLWALRRHPVAGFLGAAFLLILAPTSVVPSSVQMIVEHRMYLPLAAVIIAIACLIRRATGRYSLPLFLILALVLGGLTAQRNREYQSEAGLWLDTLAKCPTNDRAHNNLGTLLARSGQFAQAAEHFEAAIRLRPDAADAHYNLGNALCRLGRRDEAIAHYEHALRANPQMPDAELALGTAIEESGQPGAAIPHYEQALRLEPQHAETHNRLGTALAKSGRPREAIPHFEQALRLRPGQPQVHNNLGNALRAANRHREAIAHYEQAIQLDPAFAEAHTNLARTYAQTGRMTDAIRHFKQALAINPASPECHDELGMALVMDGRVSEGLAHFKEALRLKPDMAQAHLHLALILDELGHRTEAAAHFEAARRLGIDLSQ